MKKYLLIGALIVVVLGGYYTVRAVFTSSVDIPTTKVKKGEFVLSLQSTGTVDAKQAVTLQAPRIRGLQITWLAPEGSMVKTGDPVIRFDATQQISALAENEAALKIAQTTLDRSNQEYTIQEKQLLLELQRAQRNYDEKRHEAPKLAEEAKLELELAQLNSNAKLEQIKSDVAKAELEVRRAQDKVNEAKKELEQMSVSATIPGMVVYLETWKGSTSGRVQTGDSPWPGQGLVNLPDLSAMIVKATVSEVDANKVDSGLAVVVTLDALPDNQFSGVVTRKGTLARKKDDNSKVNVFDVEVAINDHDPAIKPGMSASCRIIMNTQQNVISVPLEAVFEKDGKPVVYLENKKEKEVTVGRKNDMDIEILTGLTGDETVCLVDPTLDEDRHPGDKATEPEMNKGRESKPATPGQANRQGH